MKQMVGAERERYDDWYKKSSAHMQAVRERLEAKIDYAKFAEEMYAPVFDRNFTSAELQDLIAFYKTPAGQKTATLMPELVLSGMTRGSETLWRAIGTVQQEMEAQENASRPWQQTMADLRTLGRAVEVYAIDAKRYPNVKSYSDLDLS